MTLLEFIETEGCGFEGFARLAGMNRGDVHNLAHGVRGFSVWTGLKIKRATGGKVTLDDLARPFKEKLAKAQATIDETAA